MKILISGAGIAGLSLALRLRQRGLEPVVIERSPALRDGGYMLGLSDRGYDAAERMGVAEALRAAQYLPRRIAHMSADGRVKFALEGRSLDILAGGRQLSLMRGDIERVLYQRLRDDVEFHVAASAAALDQTADGIRVRLDDGTMIEADLAVGADGLHSGLRALAFGPEEQFIRFLGARVAAFILDRSALPGIGEEETAVADGSGTRGWPGGGSGRASGRFFHVSDATRTPVRHGGIGAKVRFRRRRLACPGASRPCANGGQHLFR